MTIVADDGDNTNQQKLFKELETKRKDAVLLSRKARNQRISDSHNSISYEQNKMMHDARINSSMKMSSAMTGATEQSKKKKKSNCAVA